MPILKIVRWSATASLAMVLLLAAGVAIGWLRTEWRVGPRPDAVAATGRPEIGGPFLLVNHRGERVTEATFRGKPTAYFFGFTHCPEVCPTTLFDISRHMQDLGPDADRLNVVFVSVDPERDTPDLLKTYLESFDPRIVGLTGRPDEVAAMAKAFKVSYRRVPVDGGYTMDHTASVVVVNAAGAFVTLIDYHEDASTALAKLRRALT